MKNNKSDEHFLFALVALLSLCIGIIALFCGEDLIVACADVLCVVPSWIKKMVYGVIALMLLLPGILFFFSSMNLEGDVQDVEWHFICSEDAIDDCEKDLAKYKKIMFGESFTHVEKRNFKIFKNLSAVEFYAPEITVEKNAFSKCKNLKEVTFYEKPSSIDKDAFIGCTNLSVINFCGNKKDWFKFGVRLPAGCNVQFDFFPTGKAQDDGSSENDRRKINIDGNITVNINSGTN